MGFFKNLFGSGKNQPSGQFQVLAKQSAEELVEKMKTLSSWGINQSVSEIQQEAGTITLTNSEDVRRTGSVQFIGHLDLDQNVWHWAWADASLPSKLTQHAEKVKQYGEANNINKLTSESIPATRGEALVFLALGCKLNDTEGVYRISQGSRVTHLTIDDLVIDAGPQMLTSVFNRLNTAGIVALQKAGQTQEDGFSDCSAEFKRRGGAKSGLKGFCFYTLQDFDRMQSTNILPLSIWGDPDGAAEATERIGQIVVQEFEQSGYVVEWNGSASTRTLISTKGQPAGERQNASQSPTSISDFINQFQDEEGSPPLDPSVLEKFRSLVPNELLTLWAEGGLGSYLNGNFWVVSPVEYEDILREIYHPFAEPCLVFGRTSFGDLLVWEQGYIKFINVRHKYSEIIGKNSNLFFTRILPDPQFLQERLKNSQLEHAKDKLGPISSDTCYGYLPILGSGGTESLKNLQIVKLREHLSLIAQLSGKIK